jgi:hypothetical protein
MSSSSNIFTPLSDKFDQVCNAIESDSNFRVVQNGQFALIDLISANRHKTFETLVICSDIEASEVSAEKRYRVLKTTFHIPDDDDQTPRSAGDAVLNPKFKIAVSKKDGSVKIYPGLYGVPTCENLSPLPDRKLEEFLNQPCVLPPVNNSQKSYSDRRLG